MIAITRPSIPSDFEKFRLEEERLNISVSDQNRQKRVEINYSAIYSFALNPLKEMFKNKCAFCESPLQGNRNIDHFRPKSGARDFNSQYFPNHYWWLAYEWDNLFLACSACNNEKNDLFPIEGERGVLGESTLELQNKEMPLIINPCFDKPEEHLVYDLETGMVNGLTKKGIITIKVFSLNRPDLVSQREKEINLFKSYLKFSKKDLSDRKFKKDVKIKINDLLSEHSEQIFVATKRQVFREWLNLNQETWLKISKDETIQEKLEIDIKQDSKKDIQKTEKELSAIKQFRIKSIEIKNFKSISNLKLSFENKIDKELSIKKEKREPCLLLLGDNGVGKSSILQAIAMTLSGQRQINKLKINPLEILKRGTKSGSVKIFSTESNIPVELIFDAEKINCSIMEAPTFILGYGSTRLLPKGNMQPDKSKLNFTKINNLLDYSVSLNDIKKWIENLTEGDFETKVAPAILDILSFGDKDRVERKGNKLMVNQFGEQYSVEEMSDGYKSIIALASDMMQMLSSDISPFHNTQGIVLIDEIGNHLHPQWKMEIIGALRRAFPNLQFILTTHEPLCLRGMEYGEVNVLMRNENNKVVVLDDKVLPDHTFMRAEQLLTSDYFGLINSFDSETEKYIDAYYSLLEKPSQELNEMEKQQLEIYKKMFENKQIIGDNFNEQVYFETIKKSAEELRKSGFKTQLELKEETINHAKSLVSNLEWL